MSIGLLTPLSPSSGLCMGWQRTRGRWLGGVRGQRGHGTASRAANAAAPQLSCLQKDTQPQRAPLMAERTVAAPAASNPTAQLSRATEQSPCRFPCDAEREDPTSARSTAARPAAPGPFVLMSRRGGTQPPSLEQKEPTLGPTPFPDPFFSRSSRKGSAPPAPADDAPTGG